MLEIIEILMDACAFTWGSWMKVRTDTESMRFICMRIFSKSDGPSFVIGYACFCSVCSITSTKMPIITFEMSSALPAKNRQWRFHRHPLAVNSSHSIMNAEPWTHIFCWHIDFQVRICCRGPMRRTSIQRIICMNWPFPARLIAVNDWMCWLRILYLIGWKGFHIHQRIIWVWANC